MKTLLEESLNLPLKKKSKKILIEEEIKPIENTPIIGNDDKFTGSKDEDDAVEQQEFSCLMLKVTPATSAILSYWARKYIKQGDLYIDEDKDGYEDSEELHTTIKFGIHTENPEDLFSIIEGYGPITIKFGLVTKFDTNPNFDVIKIDVESPVLRELNTEISDNIECTDTFPDYHPHITLAYVKKGACNNLVGNDFFNLLSDESEELWFSSKSGEDYLITLEVN